MADTLGEQLLLQFGLDLSPAREAANQITNILNGLNRLSADLSSHTKQAAAEARNNAVTAKANADALVSAARAATAQEQAKTAAIRSANEALRAQVIEQQRAAAAAVADVNAKRAATAAEVGEAQKLLAQRRAETAEIQRQISELRLKRAEETKERAGHAEGSLLSRLGGTVFGGGLAGGVASGVLGGVGLAAGIAAAGEAIVHLVEKLKEVAIESGNIAKLDEQFRRLAQGLNINADAMLQEMRERTEGEISRMQLLQVATAALKSGLKIAPEEIAKVTGNIVQLAEASGKDAPAAVNALNRSLLTGRGNFARLGQAIGVTIIPLRNLPPSMNAVERASTQMAHAFKIINDQAEKMGEIPPTLEDMQRRLHVALSGAFTSFGEGLNQAGGTQSFIKLMSDFAQWLTNQGPKIQEFGRQVGNIFFMLSKSLREMLGDLGAIYTAFKSLLDFLYARMESNPIATWFSSPLDNYLEKMNAAVFMTYKFYTLWTELESAMRKVGNVFQMVLEAGSRRFTSSEILDRYMQRDEKITYDEGQKNNMMLKTLLAPASKDHPSFTPPPGDTSAPAGMLVKKAREEMNLKKQLAALDLEHRKEEIAAEKEEDDLAYQRGEKSLDDHYQRQAEISAESFYARLDEMKTQHQAELEALKSELDAKRLTHEDYNLKLQSKEAVYQRQQLETQAHFFQQLAAQYSGYLHDQQAAKQTSIQQALALSKQQNQGAVQTLEGQFRTGQVSPDEYYTRRIALIQQATDAEIAAANATYSASADKLNARAELEKKIRLAIGEAEKQLTALEEGEAEKRLQYTIKQFQPQQHALQTQLSQLASPGNANPAARTDLLEQMTHSLSAQRSQLEGLLSIAQPYSDTWYQIYNHVERTYEMQLKYTEELHNAQDLSKTIAGTFDGLGEAIGRIFTSDFARNLGSTISNAARFLSESTQLGQRLAGRSAIQKSPEMLAFEAQARSFTGTVSDTSSSFSSLNDIVRQVVVAYQSLLAVQTGKPTGAIIAAPSGSVGSLPSTPQDFEVQGSGGQTISSNSTSATNRATGAVQAFADKVMAAVAAVSNFVGTLTSAKSGLSGAVGGAISGFGVGNMVDQAFPQLGPWGAVGGAVIGGVVGLITGSKNAAIQRALDKLNDTYKSIMDKFQENTNNLQLTIQQLQALVATAQAEQSHQKKGKGRTQFQQAIDQYNQQIQQLQSQQRQLMNQMLTQLAVFQTDQGMQQFLGNLQQITDQYQKFVGAASSAQQLAQANEWLSYSLQDFSSKLTDQFAQGQEQAINDALTLNKLLQQRTDIMQNLNMQVEGVLSQGITSRQYTSAETKGRQIAQLKAQTDEQLDQLNRQIALQSYKVSTEQYIFSLAATKVGLETQLLQLQEAASDKQLRQITALQQLVNALKSGDYNFQTLQSLLSALGYSAAATTAGQTTGSIASSPYGLNNNPSTLDGLIAGAYQNRATLGFAQYRGQNI